MVRIPSTTRVATTVDANDVVTEALIQITLTVIANLRSQTPTRRLPSKGQTPSIIPIYVKLLPKSSAIPRQNAS